MDTTADSFESAIREHLDVLRRGAYRMTRDSADADELLQETLLKAFAGFGGFRAGSNLRAWLFRIMTNTHIGNYRRSRRRPDVASALAALPESDARGVDGASGGVPGHRGLNLPAANTMGD